MSFSQLLQKFVGQRAVVVGDLMLDEYIFGRATRISQEAPVMVVKQERTQSVPGGAANVARNMVALGAKVSVIGTLGDDVAGSTLRKALEEFAVADLAVDASRPTTRKTRVLANHSHQVLRMDHEVDTPVSKAIANQLLDAASKQLVGADVLLISDYSKGGVTEGLIKGLIERARQANVPVVANPKPKSLPHYRGATLVSLNRFEAGDAIGVDRLADEDAPSAAAKLREQFGVDAVLVTLGGSGMVVAWQDGTAKVPAVRVEVYDEAGAGDTVIATIALGVSRSALGETLLSLAAQTAAAVVQKVGVAAPSSDDLAKIAALS